MKHLSLNHSDELQSEGGNSRLVVFPYEPLPSVYDQSVMSRESFYNYYITNAKEKSPWIAVIIAIIYYLLAVIMPIFNDFLFRGHGKIKGYAYPLTATWLQMLGVSVVLFAFNMISHCIFQRKDVLKKSWVFGEGLAFKCKHLFLPSLSFALVMSLSNVGLFLIKDVNIHVLLRSSEIFWVVMFAFIIQREIPNLWTLLSLIILIAGTVLVSLDFSRTTKLSGSSVAITINLLSSLASGFMLVVLRRACVILRKRDPTTSVLEITLIKISIATILLIPATVALELNSWQALYNAQMPIVALVIAGVFITMAYQSTVVGLTAYSLATTVGIVSQSKIIPQIILSMAWQKKWKPTVLHIVGATLVVLASVVYGFIRWRAYKRDLEEKRLSPHSVQ